MKTLTFAFDCQLNDQEDWIAEGTQVNVSDNQFHLNRHEGFTPVIIKEGFNYDGEQIQIPTYIEWFSDRCFVELRN